MMPLKTNNYNHMKYISILILVLFFACTEKEKLASSIIPQPNNLQIHAGAFKLQKNFTIGFSDEKLEGITQRFIDNLETQFTVGISELKAADIKLTLSDTGDNREAYALVSSKDGCVISAGTETGLYYGLQSLKQLLLFSETNNGVTKLPLVEITDSPRFGWRGLMLDESRYFFGVKKVKQLLDLMAMHKLNVFHWHLTDVPGWRIEIKQYPLLTEVGAKGNDIDPDAPAQFYTQKEILEIVQYASERHIEVIPEIDMPGHAKAANLAYPEFSGGGSKSHPEFTFNPGYEGTYKYLTNILREVTSLFPSEYIHLGGDEVHFGNESWNTNKHVKRLMKQENLKDLREVESYFIHRMADSIKSLDKTVIGWDEIVDFGLEQENSVVMWWRHDRGYVLENALNKGYNVVLCPRIPLYFDFDQNESHKNGRKWKGAFSPYEMIHAFPPDTLAGFAGNERFVPGIQANIWTERIQSEERLDYMTYPRLSALAEAAWTNKDVKDLNDFNRRLHPMLDFLGLQNIEFYNPFQPEQTPEPKGLFRRNLKQK